MMKKGGILGMPQLHLWTVGAVGLLLAVGLASPAPAQVSFGPKTDFATGDEPNSVALG